MFEQTVTHPVGVGDYAKLAWVVAALATVGGALGAMVESSASVREAASRNRADERTEALAE